MLVLAHRGANRVAPENTEAAFRAARAAGADGVELDVRRAADGALVVHHDPTTRSGPVAESSLAELRGAVPGLLTLEEALDVCAGMLVDIELKSPRLDRDGAPGDRGPAVAVVELLARRSGTDRVVVSSFDPAAVGVVRALAPGIRTGLLTSEPDAAIRRARRVGDAMVMAAAAALRGARAAAASQRARAAGIGMVVWTVNEADELRRLHEAGLAAVITDAPEVAIEIVRGRRP